MRFHPANPTAGRQPLPPMGDEVTSLHFGRVPSSEFRIPNSVRANAQTVLRSWAARLLSLVASASLAWAQGTAFSYQGQLTDGAAAANGTYDLTFSLWNAATAGDQQGTTLTQTAVGVTNGLFTATLDFGGQFNGQNRWLEIAVRTNGAAAFTTLAERQPVLPTPYAIHAATATTVTGSIAATQLTGTLSAAQIPNLDASKINSGTFTGNGSGLTSLNASALTIGTVPVGRIPDLDAGKITTGTLAAARIPGLTAGHIPNLDASKITTGTFTGNGSGLTSLNASALTTGTVPGARIPDLDAGKITAGTLAAARIPALDASKVSTGTFTAAQIPNLDASKIASGVLSPDRIPTLDASKISGGTLTGNGAGLSGIPLSALVRSNYSVVTWGTIAFVQSTVPAGLRGVVAIAAGDHHILALKEDGTVVAWGDNSFGQTTVPGGLTDIVALAGGNVHSLALKADGTVVAWGYDGFGQTNVPTGLSGVIAISAGQHHSVALKADGTVVAWGRNSAGQTTIPSGLGSVAAIAGGGEHSLALKKDGTVVAWGQSYSGQTTVPAGLSGVVAIAAGSVHSLALKVDGTVVAWGSNGSGQATVPGGLGGVVAIAAGSYHSLALKMDGTVVAWGSSGSGEATVPGGLSGVVTIAAAGSHSLALKADGVSPATLARLDQGNVFSGAVSAVAFSGSGSGLTSLNASALSSGTLEDARLSANVPLKNGSPAFTAAAGTRVASFTGIRTGDHNAAVVHVENTQTGPTAAPALRVFGRGGDAEGALSVTANAGTIARFGNFTTWVAKLDNSGNFSATSFITLSDRNQKAGFAPVDVDSVLAKVAALPLTTWHYTNDVAATPHLGPMAQDFHAAFGLGGDDKTIATVDADGIALAAIQGLHRKTEVLAAENAELRGELTELRTLVLQLQQQLNANRP